MQASELSGTYSSNTITGDSKMTRLEAQSPVNAISTSQPGGQQHGGQQQQQGQGQPQQGAAAGQSQNPTAAFTLPPGYYNFYNNPPVLPGGYSYPPNMFPVGPRALPYPYHRPADALAKGLLYMNIRDRLPVRYHYTDRCVCVH